jgi:1-acyl-sn-glycerol-3-phosphate acyltransferase
MQKIISYPVTAIAMVVFFVFLLVFHPIQWICFNVFGYQAHKKSVDYLNCILVRTGHLIGTRYEVVGRENIPKGVPIIFVANHQSLYDIICIIWFLRKWHPKFVSKIELAKGVPSVSYNLRHGGSALIDRKNPKQAIPAISGLGKYIERTGRSAVIFPEGTRSSNGQPKPFSTTGLKILCENAPSAFMVPITINNSWKINKYGFFPLGLGNKLTFVVHKPYSVSSMTFDEIIGKTENDIVGSIKL